MTKKNRKKALSKNTASSSNEEVLLILAFQVPHPITQRTIVNLQKWIATLLSKTHSQSKEEESLFYERYLNYVSSEDRTILRYHSEIINALSLFNYEVHCYLKRLSMTPLFIKKIKATITECREQALVQKQSKNPARAEEAENVLLELAFLDYCTKNLLHAALQAAYAFLMRSPIWKILDTHTFLYIEKEELTIYIRVLDAFYDYITKPTQEEASEPGYSVLKQSAIDTIISLVWITKVYPQELLFEELNAFIERFTPIYTETRLIMTSGPGQLLNLILYGSAQLDLFEEYLTHINPREKEKGLACLDSFSDLLKISLHPERINQEDHLWCSYLFDQLTSMRATKLAFNRPSSNHFAFLTILHKKLIHLEKATCQRMSIYNASIIQFVDGVSCLLSFSIEQLKRAQNQQNNIYLNSIKCIKEMVIILFHLCKKVNLTHIYEEDCSIFIALQELKAGIDVQNFKKSSDTDTEIENIKKSTGHLNEIELQRALSRIENDWRSGIRLKKAEEESRRAAALFERKKNKLQEKEDESFSERVEAQESNIKEQEQFYEATAISGHALPKAIAIMQHLIEETHDPLTKDKAQVSLASYTLLSIKNFFYSRVKSTLQKNTEDFQKNPHLYQLKASDGKNIATIKYHRYQSLSIAKLYSEINLLNIKIEELHDLLLSFDEEEKGEHFLKKIQCIKTNLMILEEEIKSDLDLALEFLKVTYQEYKPLTRKNKSTPNKVTLFSLFREHTTLFLQENTLPQQTIESKHLAQREFEEVLAQVTNEQEALLSTAQEEFDESTSTPPETVTAPPFQLYRIAGIEDGSLMINADLSYRYLCLFADERNFSLIPPGWSLLPVNIKGIAFLQGDTDPATHLFSATAIKTYDCGRTLFEDGVFYPLPTPLLISRIIQPVLNYYDPANQSTWSIQPEAEREMNQLFFSLPPSLTLLRHACQLFSNLGIQADLLEQWRFHDLPDYISTRFLGTSFQQRIHDKRLIFSVLSAMNLNVVFELTLEFAASKLSEACLTSFYQEFEKHKPRPSNLQSIPHIPEKTSATPAADLLRSLENEDIKSTLIKKLDLLYQQLKINVSFDDYLESYCNINVALECFQSLQPHVEPVSFVTAFLGIMDKFPEYFFRTDPAIEEKQEFIFATDTVPADAFNRSLSYLSQYLRLTDVDSIIIEPVWQIQHPGEIASFLDRIRLFVETHHAALQKECHIAIPVIFHYHYHLLFLSFSDEVITITWSDPKAKAHTPPHLFLDTLMTVFSLKLNREKENIKLIILDEQTFQTEYDGFYCATAVLSQLTHWAEEMLANEIEAAYLFPARLLVDEETVLVPPGEDWLEYLTKTQAQLRLLHLDMLNTDTADKAQHFFRQFAGKVMQETISLSYTFASVHVHAQSRLNIPMRR